MPTADEETVLRDLPPRYPPLAPNDFLPPSYARPSSPTPKEKNGPVITQPDKLTRYLQLLNTALLLGILIVMSLIVKEVLAMRRGFDRGRYRTAFIIDDTYGPLRVTVDGLMSLSQHVRAIGGYITGGPEKCWVGVFDGGECPSY